MVGLLSSLCKLLVVRNVSYLNLEIRGYTNEYQTQICIVKSSNRNGHSLEKDYWPINYYLLTKIKISNNLLIVLKV